MRVDTPNGPVAMVYSGEAYNFSELRAELYGRGHRFRTDSDTEVQEAFKAEVLEGPSSGRRLLAGLTLAATVVMGACSAPPPPPRRLG
jgi:glucosamine 6-phosphate synthetase-like amidotransferase/phosphosugar isomerase protein